jgi:hypothetical protein
VSFKDGKTGAFPGMGQSLSATQPGPVTSAFFKPSLRTDGNRAVVRMFHGKLEKDFVCRPFSGAPAQDVCPLGKEGTP